MFVFSKNMVSSPIETTSGEMIFELLGRNSKESSEKQSIAYIVIPPGKSSLLHYHPEAEETYYILKGQARMILGDEEREIEAGKLVLIPTMKLHKIINIGKIDLEFLTTCVPAWESNDAVYMER